MNYKANVSPKQAFEALRQNPHALLIDVRTPAELTYVGVPQMPAMLQVAWPPIEGASAFADTIIAMRVPKRTEIYLICRSGYRSARAAEELTEAGYENCYNVAEGFEGDRDEYGHRGTVGGWKVAGLPWVQG